MAAKITNPGTQTFNAPRDHGPFRLNAQTIAVVEDIAMGIEAGDAGLKSCTMGAMSAASLGAGANAVAMQHAREVVEIEDEDECFDAIGDLLAKGYSHAEIRKTVRLSGGSTHLHAIERWCDRVRLSCDADAAPQTELASMLWWGSGLRDRRRRCERAMAALRSTAEGASHAAVLHIVYGWPDPFVNTLPAEVRVALGPEFAPLARYTDTVEAKRMAMVREGASRGARTYVPAHERVTEIHPHERQLIGLSAAIAYANETLEMFRLAANHGVDITETPRSAAVGMLFDLERGRSLMHWFDRNLSSGDALRAGVGAFLEPMPVQGERETKRQLQARKDARKGRLVEHRAKVAAFVTAIKVDANRMLTTASEAFKAAWQRS
jgi:hypothetical protein